MDLYLKRASRDDMYTVWRMQVEVFTPLLEKYQDHGLSPAQESLEDLLKKYDMPETTYYLISAEDNIVGAIRVVDRKDGSRKRISPVFIMPEYRNKGYAQKAILEAERLHGQDNWSLNTILQEKRNLHLYEKLGYHRTGETLNVNERMDVVFLEK